MSQIIKNLASGPVPPDVPTTFIGDTGPGATAVANILNVLGDAGVSVDATGNTLTIKQSASGLTWNDVAVNFAAASNNGYFVSANAIGTLPAAPAQGDEIEFCIVNGTTTLVIQANAGQQICIGLDLSAVAGTTTGDKLGDSISFTYQASSATWFSVTSPQGTWTTV
jgi:hypothetical protein